MFRDVNAGHVFVPAEQGSAGYAGTEVGQMTGRILGKCCAAVLALVLTGSAAGAAEETVLRSRDLRFEITVPDGWEDLAGRLTQGRADAPFLIRCGSAREPAFLLFGCEEKNPEVLGGFDDYQEWLVKGVTESPLFGDVRVSNSMDIIIRGPGLRGKMTSFTAKYDVPPEDEGGEEAAESAVESAVEPIAESAAEPMTESAAEPIAESAVESAAESAAESIAEKTAPAPEAGQTRTVDVICRLYAIEGVREYYQFFCWTGADRAAEMGLVFDRIVNSLRIMR